MSNNKYLIIRYAPPASGKSRIIDMMQKEYGIDSFFVYDIDGAVESKEGYQKDIQDCIKHFKSIESPEQLDQNVVKKCTDIYFHHRRDVFEKLDAQEAEAISKGKSIVYETTGCTERHINYLKNVIANFKQKGYKIVLYYPVVPLHILKKRAFSRAQTSGRFTQQLCVMDAVRFVNELVDYVDDMFFYNNARGGEPKYMMVLKSTTGAVYCNRKELEFFSKHDELYKYLLELYDKLCYSCFIFSRNNPGIN